MNRSFLASAIIAIAVVGQASPKLVSADNIDSAGCTAETRQSLEEEASRLGDAILDNRVQWAELMTSAPSICNDTRLLGGLDIELIQFACESMLARITQLNIEYHALVWDLRDIWVRYYPACDPYATILPHRDGYYLNLHDGLPFLYPPEISGRERPAPEAPLPEITEAPPPPVDYSTAPPPPPESMLFPHP